MVALVQRLGAQWWALSPPLTASCGREGGFLMGAIVRQRRLIGITLLPNHRLILRRCGTGAVRVGVVWATLHTRQVGREAAADGWIHSQTETSNYADKRGLSRRHRFNPTKKHD